MTKNFIIFQISRNKAIIDIENIQEIIVRPEQITPILDSDLYVEGLVNLRGEAIPIIDLRTFLNVEKFNEDENVATQTILIIKKDNKRLGIIVDAIYHVEQIEVGEEDISNNRNSLYNAYFPKIVRLNDQLINIFDSDLIFDDISL